ncbi:unconventional myosin-X [Chrysoperla carnea]|uniref:unconventional myosin-X n=1 Tax=Chrysoperla carnea TaxID=189513 RepID=UPI001D094DC7|nr:unconventional myosin-X [Chrysoperla carnea]
MATLGLSKVFILDKYFTELQKFWETEKKLQDASSSNEAVHLQQRLRSLSTELVTLRNRLHVGGQSPTVNNNNNNNNSSPSSPNSNNNNNNKNLNNNKCNNNNITTNIYNTTTSTITAPSVATQAAITNKLNISQTITNNNNVITSQLPITGIPGNNNNNTPLSQPIVPPRVQTNTTTNLTDISRAVTRTLPIQHSNNNNNNSNNNNNISTCTGTNLSTGTSQTNLTINNTNGTTITSPTTQQPHNPNCGINNSFVNGQYAGITSSTTTATALQTVIATQQQQQQQQQQNGNNVILQNNNNNSCNKLPITGFETEDLIHLPGPLTEDAVIKCLHARFCTKQYYTNVGPILLCVNPYNDVGNPLTLSSTRCLSASPQLNKVVQEAVRQQSETGYPQAIILSGTSGSGKTHASMLLLRQLFAVAGGGPETDAFKHLAAAFTVLRSLGSAKTSYNSESSRIGQFIEVQVTDGALYRTKIHCYFLDQTRVIRPLSGEKNYHIFYQMLAGLSNEERTKLCLEGYGPRNLRFLQRGDTRQDTGEDAARFQAWKACLGVLGIPFLDVVRVLAAVLLLGNVQFADGKSLEVEVKGGGQELNAAAGLLGVAGPALFRGLTSRTHNARGQLVRAVCDANISNMTRDCLAKALYCRTVATIVRRANSLKRLGSTLGTLSSDSNESVHNQHIQNADVASQHATSTVTSGGGAGTAGAKSMAALNNAVRHATDGFIGILDMFGFEDHRPSQLEHLCINLCAETMQHFYNTHIFKSSIESCRDEGIDCELEVDYIDNVPCIDLISSLRTGLLSMLDAECSVRGTAESFVSKVRVQHRQNPRLFEPRPPEPRTFGIQHFAGRVVYDASDFLDTNKDVIPDDLVSVFYKHSCNFGFATHLFGSELKALYSSQNVPRGISFRISPTSHTDLLNGDEPVSTLTQDFHTRLDNLLRTLVHARPHFVRCIRSNPTELPGRFDRMTAMKQIRALQVLETVNLMAGGFPHRMRFKAFYGRYKLLAPFGCGKRPEDKVIEDCQTILRYACDQFGGTGLKQECVVAVANWALGKRHIFLSESIRQQLEMMRTNTRQSAAILIQATWRGWKVKRRWAAALRREREIQGGRRPRPQPIAGTPPPEQVVEQTCNLFGLDLERPPPVPPSRSYTVAGNTKLGYPQTRVMKMSFPEDEPAVLMKGETVLVVGASHRRGHLVVQHKHCTLHVPFQFLELNHPPCTK